VTIAKVDATANDVPDEIQGFPTIKLFPAGSKDSPVDYAGSRTIEDLANFVKENGKHKVDAYVEEAAQAAAGGDVTGAPGSADTAEPEAEKAEEKAAEHEEL
jgi:protein disulfide-isomerase A1